MCVSVCVSVYDWTESLRETKCCAGGHWHWAALTRFVVRVAVTVCLVCTRNLIIVVVSFLRIVCMTLTDHGPPRHVYTNAKSSAVFTARRY